MTCICGSVLVSVKYDGYREWTCPHILLAMYGPHSEPFVDRRLAVVQRPQLQKPEGRPGPKGLPGSRAKRQPWNRGKVRPGTLADWTKKHYVQARGWKDKDNSWRRLGQSRTPMGKASIFARPIPIFETNKPRGRADRWEREALVP